MYASAQYINIISINQKLFLPINFKPFWFTWTILMSVCVECCVLSGRGLCYGLITRPEKSYRLWCVVACDLETSRMRMPWLALGRSATGKKILMAYSKAKLKKMRVFHQQRSRGIYVCFLLLTTRFFDVAKFSSLTPLSLLSSCIFTFPIVGLKILSLPAFALKSPKRIFLWYLWELSQTCSHSS